MMPKALRYLLKTSSSPGKHAEAHQGFVLPLVISLGLILTVGGFALIARSFGALTKSIRLEQAQQAREIAEAGIAETIENLNRRFNYLLINCYQNSTNECENIVFNTDTGKKIGLWNEPRYPSAVM